MKICTKDSLLAVKCRENNIEYRLTKLCTAKTNGMLERVNGNIKNNTILLTNCKNHNEIQNDLNEFLIYFYINRRPDSLRKELKVKMSFQVIEKWYLLKPEIFGFN